MAEFMNPSHLSADELAEELRIRQIVATGQGGLRLLNQAIMNEEVGKAFPPGPPTGLRVQSEVRQCKDLIKTLTEEIQNLSKSSDESLMRRLRSKFLHLRGKVRRLSVVSGSDEPTISLNNQVNQMDTLFAAIRDYVSSDGSNSPPENVNRGSLDEGAVGGTATSAPSTMGEGLFNPVTLTAPTGNNNVWGSASLISDAFHGRNNTSLSYVAPPNADTGIISALMSTASSLHQGPMINNVSTGSTQVPQPPPRYSFIEPTNDSNAQSFNTLSTLQQVPHTAPQTVGQTGSGASVNDFMGSMGYSRATQYPPSIPHTTQPPQQYIPPANLTLRQAYIPNQQNVAIPPEFAPHPQNVLNQQNFGLQQAYVPHQQHVAVPQVYAQNPLIIPNPQNFAQNVPAYQGQAQQPAGAGAVRPVFTHQMSKWNLTFSGKDSDMWVDDFLFRVETLARSANIGLDVLPLGMHYLLHGTAQDWFWIYHRNNPQATWAAFADEMRHQFSSTETELELYDKVRNRKQRSGESFAQFSVDVCTLAARLRNPLAEADLLEHLRANMNVGLRTALLYHPSPNLRALRDAAKTYEKLVNTKVDLRLPSRHINEVSELHQGPHPNVQAVYMPPHAQGSTSSQHQYQYFEPAGIEAFSRNGAAPAVPVATNRADLLTCWNCDEMGHTFLDCEVATKNVFCYGCGTKNVYRPSCPKCLQGNLRQGGVTHAQHRPNETPTRVTPNPFVRR